MSQRKKTPRSKGDSLDQMIETATKRNPEFPAKLQAAEEKIQSRRNCAISWRDVAKAISIYEADGFRYVEVPWYVSDLSVNVTLPRGVKALRCVRPSDSPLRIPPILDLPLVGSAEQSFIEMALHGELDPGKYVAASPCFRDDKPDNLHQKTFFKVELIEITSARPSKAAVRAMAEIALSFYHMLEGGEAAEIVETPEGLDISLRGVELGSYGRRSLYGLNWVYGTGFAEPRFSIVSAMD